MVVGFTAVVVEASVVKDVELLEQHFLLLKYREYRCGCGVHCCGA